jgi:hypothetical protein
MSYALIPTQCQSYSYWSGLAQTETNPTVKAQEQATADTHFNTLRTMQNTAWTFSVIEQIALVAAIGLLVASFIILAALAFEVVEVVRGRETLDLAETGAASALASPVPLAMN